ncbi:VacJ family lipoprotein [Methyloceanibacter sp.]|uniref:MlaA family lipoprotein n=1 Tax=Methyloceanibacter sp. TaxID=1965321 RepID=UPI002D6F6722|nr:VacJ family lipoprotein [Methyloceanibacter sp.]HZP09859.1 VacJ family lipoprotein [Methyloceanibacter sp.]
MRARDFSIAGRIAALVLTCGLAACASGGTPAPEFLAAQPPASTMKDASAPVEAPADDVAALPEDQGMTTDPYEKMNRAMFERNQRINHAVIYPVAKAYHDTVPDPVRKSVSNFADNLGEPMVFANDLLQLRLGAAATTAGRFAVNSTIGIGGLFDVATSQKLEKQSGDFGQTLYVWGMRKSNYLVVPVIGPTNVRDLIGTTVELVATIPAGGLLQQGIEATHYAAQAANTANTITVAGSVATPITKLDDVQQMQALEDSSLDFYTMLRSVVEQKRQAELDEAVANSLWTAPPPSPAAASTSPSTLMRRDPPRAAKEEELLSNVLTAVQ